MANPKKDDKIIGAFIAGGVGDVLGVLGGPVGVAVGGGAGAWLGHEIEKWLARRG
jgi:hypothetical protein